MMLQARPAHSMHVTAWRAPVSQTYNDTTPMQIVICQCRIKQ